MSDSARHDAWQAGESYDAYMGRWSRKIAPRFLTWLDVAERLDWLEVGCGTGVLSAAIWEHCKPRSLVAIDPSEGFLATARKRVPHSAVSFLQGDAQGIALGAASVDVIVSGLVMNFVPDRKAALARMRRVARAGGTIAFYVWDYPGGGMEFMRAFWRAASELDPGAKDLAEDRRFPFCTPEGLTDLAREVGLHSIECQGIEVPTVFADFDDYWRPFTLGTGPAPGYCAGLDSAARETLRHKLDATLPRQPDGSIHLRARAWALKAKVPAVVQ